MPTKPKQHKPQGDGKRQSDNRPSAGRRGYGRRWRKLRLMVLRRDPICVRCKCRASTHADHIAPKSRGGDDSFENLQGLCETCHNRKTVVEDGGFGR